MTAWFTVALWLIVLLAGMGAAEMIARVLT